MIVLIIFAFISGIVTILSPCILPILPILLSGTLSGSKKRPFGIITGFVLSFTFFTLSLATIVKLTGLSADYLRVGSILIIFLFGISLLVPKMQLFIEQLASKLTPNISSEKKDGYLSGILLGCSLGLVWTPCVGPIIASVITLAATSNVTFGSILITLSYAIGTAIPMTLITLGGRGILNKVPSLTKNLSNIQKMFGLIMILVAISMFFNLDRKFQTYILTKFPNYGTGLTKFEDNNLVNSSLGNKNNTSNTPTQLVQEKNYPVAPEIIPGGEWFNTQPLKISELKGKVVLIDFWTYTCINCIRTLPYIQAWNKKYADKGLVVIGVHTPEFEFEKDANNLKSAIKDFGLTYPIVQDNNYETWGAYSNHYWPAKYFINKEGKIVSYHFGEGGYDEAEKLIQDLLNENTQNKISEEISNPVYEVGASTPETYLGYSRIQYNQNAENISKEQLATYTFPASLSNDHFAYEGTWYISGEYAQPNTGAQLEINFKSKDVYLVMKTKNNSTGRVNVYLDDNLVSTKGGNDIKNSIVDINENKLYHLIHLNTPERHILKLEFLDNNIQIFAFTFG